MFEGCLLTLFISASIEVVAVVEGGVTRSEGVRFVVAVVGVVRAGVETVG